MSPMMSNWSVEGQLVKQPITYGLSVLYPPNAGAPPPTTRERPPGCRTVFIGGLPEVATEEIIVDVFGKCGEIQTIRMSKKNFCHIRYQEEYCVDNAVYLSGWRMRIGNNTDGPSTGRLHVDFAQARDDLYEWECQTRAIQREMRHRDDLTRPPSPPPVPHFSDHEATTLNESLRGEKEGVTNALETLGTWLERGDCSKRNSSTFYTMIQTASSHVKRLLGDQTEIEQELTKLKEDFKTKMTDITVQFGQIERVFTSTSHQKVWDHFTKAQRKNITAWRKQLADIVALTSNSSNLAVEEDMDLSEDEATNPPGEPEKKKNKKTVVKNPEKLREESEKWARRNANTQEKLRQESEDWAGQAQVYRNEVETVKAEMKTELASKDQQLKILQQTLQGLQQQLLQSRGLQHGKVSTTVKKKVSKPVVHVALESSEEKKSDEEKTDDDAAVTSVEKEAVDDDKTNADTDESEETTTESVEPKVQISGQEGKLLAVISTFLHVHPFGAGADYIWSYLLKVDPSVSYNEVEDLMTRHPDCFSMELEGVGATLVRKWRFVAFNPA